MRSVKVHVLPTLPVPFARALEAVAHELALHDGEKRDVWRQQTPAYHAWHALCHVLAALLGPLVGARHLVRMHLAHAACRTLMALEQFVAAFGRDVRRTTCPPPKKGEPVR